jgi:hypothetical protein
VGVGSGGSNVGNEGAAENLGRVGLAYAEESALELDVLPIELVLLSAPFRQDSQTYRVKRNQQLVLKKHPKQSGLDLSREKCLPCV